MNPPAFLIPFSDLLNEIRASIPRQLPVYLVGGAIRDMLVDKDTHDLDFVLSENAIPIARSVADAIGGAFYILDEDRHTARVILESKGRRRALDFSEMRGTTLLEDLIDRDFTCNAIALDISAPDLLIDPLHGAEHLSLHKLEPCSKKSFLNDPLRIIRAVRLSVEYELRISKDSNRLLKSARHLISSVSSERMRDELFRILDGKKPETSIRMFDQLGVLKCLLPELHQLKTISEADSITNQPWEHVLHSLGALSTIEVILTSKEDLLKRQNLNHGLMAVCLGSFGEKIENHLQTHLTPDRSVRSLLRFTALYHVSNRQETNRSINNQEIQNKLNISSASRIVFRAKELKLSNREIDRLNCIVQNQQLLQDIVFSEPGPTTRSMYRFFRDFGEAGIDICLLSLAESLSADLINFDQDTWTNQLRTVQAMFKYYWEEFTSFENSPGIVDGNDLIKELKVPPGPVIGLLLEEINEAVAVGELASKEEAIKFALEKIKEIRPKENLRYPDYG